MSPGGRLPETVDHWPWAASRSRRRGLGVGLAGGRVGEGGRGDRRGGRSPDHDRERLRVAPGASRVVRVTVKGYVPAVVGVPVIAPVALERARPGGEAPAQRPGVRRLPTRRDTACEYACPTVPAGVLAVVTWSGSRTSIVSPCVRLVALSVTWTVKE